MMKRRIHSFCSSLWVGPIALALSYTTLAHAEEDATETAAARALALDGLKLAKAGQCREAVDKLERAEKLRHSPLVLARLGECYVSLGKLVQGSEALRKVLREPLPADANPNLTQAYERAQALVQEVKPSIAGLTITLTGGDTSKVTMLVDGKEVPSTVIGVELPLDPGDHLIEVSGPAYLKSSAHAKLVAGEKQAMSIELRPDPEALARQKAEAEQAANARAPQVDEARPRESRPLVSATTTPEPKSGSSGNKTLAYVSYGVGALGVGAGILFGRAAMSAKSDLEGQCPNKVCPASEQDSLDSAKTKGVLSTVGFGVGAAGIVLGTVLLATSGGSSSTSSGSVHARPQHASTHFGLQRPRAAIGLTSIHVAADF